MQTGPQGLYRYDGTAWTRVGADVLTSTRRVTAVAVDPTDSDRVAVGTSQDGLYVSSDGGQTFTNWTTQLDPGYASMPTTFPVSALAWGGGRLFVGVSGFGVFVSGDGGTSFTRAPLWVKANLDAPASPLELPRVNAFTIDPANPDRILAALFYHGVFESLDGGASWQDLYGDLVVADPEEGGAWIHTAQSVAVDPGEPQVLVMGVLQRGLFRTADGGATWQPVAGALQPTNRGELTTIRVTAVPGQPGRFLALEDKWNLLESLDGGLSWQVFAQPLPLKTALVILPVAGVPGDLIVGTWAGGTYVPGTFIPLAQTYTSGTSAELRGLNLGLEVAFDAGTVAAGDAFELVAQTYQGWAVWRAPAADPNNMTLIGLYDRVNPESCIVGYCGDVNFEPIPQCFAEKRAACFTNVGGDTIRFFDNEIYNGFAYYYAVSSFDYGNTAATTPENNNKAMLFSPRWDGDRNSPFAGQGNRSFVRVNLSAEPAAQGEEIYVYPNPLRLNSGIPGEDGVTVVWTNLPPSSRIRVFTTAGDDVADLGPDNQVGGQIRWLTRNREQEPVAAGVYLYKVESPSREPYWGRLVVIR
ncbi:MAG: WD40/YVTN/BNR-like repeat-containing protein [Candidatus Krumholzibacteriia bacterium]